MNTNTFPGFALPAADIENYICGIDFIVMSTLKKQVVRHDTTDVAAFSRWLTANGAKDITAEAGSLVVEFYRRLGRR